MKTKSDGLMCEGVVVDKRGNMVDVDFGDDIEEVEISACVLVLPGTDFEEGDVVEVQPPGDFLYFKGHVTSINYANNTIDVHMDGDDEDDVERNVTYDRVRKLMTSRPLALEHWHTTTRVLLAANKFLSHIHHMRVGNALIKEVDDEFLAHTLDNPFLNDKEVVVEL